MAGLDIIGKGQKRTWKTAVVWSVAVSVVLTSVFSAYFSVFAVNVQLYQTMILMGIVASLTVFLLWDEKKTKRNVMIALIASLGFAGVYWKRIYEGIIFYVDSYGVLKKQYDGINSSILHNEPDIPSILIVTAVIGMVLSIILVAVLKARKGIICLVLIMMIPVFLAGTVGKLPNTWMCFGLMAAGCVYAVVYHQNKDKPPMRELFTAAAILLVLLSCSTASKQMLVKYKEKHQVEYQNIRQVLMELQDTGIDGIKKTVAENFDGGRNFAGGGLNEGNLSGLSSAEISGKTAMEITVTKIPEGKIYLKAFVGSFYTGKEWDKLGALEFAKVISPFGGAKDKRNLMSEPYRKIADGNNSVKEQQIELSLKATSSKFAYTPYYSNITKGDSVNLDAFVEGDGKKQRQYTYYPAEDVERISSTSLAQSSELWKEYQEFVKKTYVEEYTQLKELRKFCNTLNKNSSATVGSGIDQMFNRYLRYSRKPGEMPKDMDFIEGFLFEKRVGFCVHFASAATVIYQICGIPARYVEGYTVSPGQFTLQEDGTYKAFITDEKAHAWCEVFDDELGWQVREHTLSYTENEDLGSYVVDSVSDRFEEPEEPAENTPDLTEKNLPEEEPEVQDEGQDAESEMGESIGLDEGIQKNGNIKALFSFAVLIGSGLLSVAVIILQQRIRRGKRLRSFRIKKDNRGIINMYNAICDICVFAGLETREMTERQRAGKMAETFSQLTEEEWNLIYMYAEQAAFSGKQFSIDEQKEMYRLYRSLRKEIIKTFTRKQKLWFLYGKAY